MSAPTKHHFQKGDRAIVIWSHTGAYVGETVTVISDLQEFNTNQSGRMMGYRIDIISSRTGRGFIAKPEWLKPVYDGHEPCAWDESLFNPFKESVKC